MLQNLLFKKPASSGGVIATLTMVAGKNKKFMTSNFGYSYTSSEDYGTLTPDSFDCKGYPITIKELYYQRVGNVIIRMGYLFGYSVDMLDQPKSITIRIGDTVLTCSGQEGYITDSICAFEYGETYTIEILSITF